jgi:hypothetical protein
VCIWKGPEWQAWLLAAAEQGPCRAWMLWFAMLAEGWQHLHDLVALGPSAICRAQPSAADVHDPRASGKLPATSGYC